MSALRAGVVAMLSVSVVEAHISAVCTSVSSEQPDYATLWIASYHSSWESERGVVHVRAPSGANSSSTVVYCNAPDRRTSNTVDEIASLLQSSCGYTEDFDGDGVHAMPYGSSMTCHGYLGSTARGNDRVPGCSSNLYTWYSVIVPTGELGDHEVWLEGATYPLMPSRVSTRHPCEMSPSRHVDITFHVGTCGAIPDYDNLKTDECGGNRTFFIGESCDAECDVGYRREGELQCEEGTDTNGTGVWSSNFSCVPFTTAEPTVAPPTAEPTAIPPTDAPLTRVPGTYTTCNNMTVFDDDTTTGEVSFLNYGNYERECWKIECNTTVIIRWTSFSTERNYDYMTISTEVREDVYQQVYRYAGALSSGTEHTWAGPLFMQFTSDGSVTYPGFEFEFFCADPTEAPPTAVPTPAPPTDVPQTSVPYVLPECVSTDTVLKPCGSLVSRACAYEVKHPARLLSVAFSGDGSRVATGAADRVVRVFSARTGEQMAQLGCADGFKVYDIAFSPNNDLVALAGEGGRVIVCDAATGVLQATLVDLNDSGSTPVTSVQFSHDGRYAVSGGGSDSRTRIFDVLASDADPSTVIQRHAREAAFDTVGNFLATVWGTEVGEVTSVWSLSGSGGSSNSGSGSGSGNSSSSSDSDSDSSDSAYVSEVQSMGGHVKALGFSHDQELMRAMEDGWVRVTRWSGGSIGVGHAEEHFAVRMPSGAVHDSRYSRDGSLLAAVGEGDVMVWSKNGTLVADLLGHSEAVVARVAFAPDNTRLASASSDGSLIVWTL